MTIRDKIRAITKTLLRVVGIVLYGFLQILGKSVGLFFRASFAFWRVFFWFIKPATQIIGVVVIIFVMPFLIGIVVLSTPRDVAYRNLHADLPICKDGLETAWTVLAASDPQKAKIAAAVAPADDWVDASNNELDAIAKDPIWAKRLRCSLQRHMIPSVGETVGARKKPIEYYLNFVEYRENGDPYSLFQDGKDADEPVSSEFLKQISAETNVAVPITQLDVLKRHLRTGSNYVVVFVHGWRHDASIGDQNVADLRHYAAHVARFLADRCESERLYCDTKVTGVYIGWRGARVNENGMKAHFGPVGEYLAELAGGATLFDRKPVSERIAPGVISALRTIENVLSPRDMYGSLKLNAPTNKMIVFGHSLGGNLLITGLKDDILKAVRRHNPSEQIPSVLGDLVVLINPAAEASKWTEVQREVWDRLAFHTDKNTSIDMVKNGHRFFPVDQKPVIMSITSAMDFPPGGLRDGDCQWINLDVNDGSASVRALMKRQLAKSQSMFAEGLEYDTATHDLFPTFKFDFRPLAEWLDRKTARIEGRPAPGSSCEEHIATWYKRVLSLPVRASAGFFRVFPFQNTDRESSHTVGNLDPPRPAMSSFVEYLTSAAPFGTTHEMNGLLPRGAEPHHDYSTITDAPTNCPPANNWLRRARLMNPNQDGVYWESNYLLSRVPGVIEENQPAARFTHGFTLGGTAAITRANDPFWNIRAFDNVLSKHDGFRLSSFICAMNQFVMDDITASLKPIPNWVPNDHP